MFGIFVKEKSSVFYTVKKYVILILNFLSKRTECPQEIVKISRIFLEEPVLVLTLVYKTIRHRAKYLGRTITLSATVLFSFSLFFCSVGSLTDRVILLPVNPAHITLKQ